MLGQDSTGQRITFIVIGLIVAALALAILTAWYYRVTDPGPKRSKAARGSEESPGGGTPTQPPIDPQPGPGWRKRLSGFSVPDDNAVTAKEAGVAKKSRVDKKAQRAKVKAQSRAEAAQAKVDDAEVPSPDGGYLPEQPTVSLEGGYYLDLTDAPRGDEPQTNVGSLNSLDLRQPAPLVDPSEVPVPAPTSAEGGLSFDDWLAEAEAIDEL